LGKYDTKPCENCGNKIPPRSSICRFCQSQSTPLGTGGTYNKFGIPRDIPVDVERTVRKECGFGCVICGEMLIEYDHFEPPFHEVKEEHNASGIALLCPTHHSQRLGKYPVLNAETVQQHRLNPRCLQADYHPRMNSFFASPGPAGIKIASTVVFGPAAKVCIDGNPILWYQEPSGSGLYEPIKFGMELEDNFGQTWLKIEDNVLKVKPPLDVDIVCESAFVEIRYLKKTVLKIARYDIPKVDEETVAWLNSIEGEEGIYLRDSLGVGQIINVFHLIESNIHVKGMHIEVSTDQFLVNGISRLVGNIRLESGSTTTINL